MESKHGYSALYTPRLKGPTDEQVVAAQQIVDDRYAAIKEQKQNSIIECQSCGGMHRIQDLTYIQTHFYIRPHGCTGGDYWKQGEGQYRCPACSHLNRLYKSPEVVELKSYFKSVEDRHDDR